MKDKQPARRKAGTASTGLTAEERAAMRETMQERARQAKGGVDGEADLMAKIAEMPESDRVMAERIHAIVKAVAPDLVSRTWYGMPAYVKDGNVVCFFQGGYKFKARFAMLGFSDKAKLDEGDMWPVYFALKKLSQADEKRIGELIKKAVG